MKPLIIFALITTINAQANKWSEKFPKDFQFGAASSAYQIEGGWNADGKGKSNWDVLTHSSPHIISDGSNGDIACDSYHKYEEDIQLLKELGVDFYRFSISWPRILPEGFISKINPSGVQYYKNLIAGLKAANIEPMVTLYHWDLPKSLDYLGDFSNRLIVDYFVDYADLAFRLFGDDVKVWITYNEPKSFCQELQDGYASIVPEVPSGVMDYQCTHNVLLSHAKVWHLYQDKYKRKQGGKISMALSVEWSEPASNSSRDLEAAERKRLFDFGWYAHPLVFGDYPQVMIDRIAKKSRKQGYRTSRLPKFTPSEKRQIKGAFDFLGINHYSSYMVSWKDEVPNDIPNFYNDSNVNFYKDPSWPTSASTWLTVVPWGFRKLLNWVKDTYGEDIEIYVTENGFSDDGQLNDTGRIDYYKGYLEQALLAIHTDKVKLKAFTAWSIMDNFEWINGYKVKFGLYQVDFSDPNRTRTAKSSAKYYQEVIRTRRP